MRIDGIAGVLAALAACVGAAVLLGRVWDRARRTGRILAAAASLVSVLATAGLELNRLTETYPTWGALAGAAPTSASPGRSSGTATAATGSQVVTLKVAGRGTGMTMPAYVYLPAAYRTAAGRDARFPVIEALHGYPGSPRTWLNRLGVQAHLDAEIAAGRMAPTVVVFPYLTPAPLLDTECTNLVRGPKAETYLTVDVPAAIRAHFGVRADRAGWAVTGFSAGGFCATDLLLRHPDRYAAAASLSGYAAPGIAIGDGSENTTANAAWRLRHLPAPAASLYLGYAADDKHACRDARLLAGLARSPLEVTTAVVAHGGHSDAVWETMEGPAFDWLGARLARPARVDGVVAR
ncbi:alpha/beta hydrolase [Krasilnikovia sp. MM14-A1259]|uniref:alpha/beta hydrolase n=1 Tax=Krasilnikovia sp. MM14-A1259 TaxID=3373539 RepID=UPI0037F79874